MNKNFNLDSTKKLYCFKNTTMTDSIVDSFSYKSSLTMKKKLKSKKSKLFGEKTMICNIDDSPDSSFMIPSIPSKSNKCFYLTIST